MVWKIVNSLHHVMGVSAYCHCVSCVTQALTQANFQANDYFLDMPQGRGAKINPLPDDKFKTLPN